MLDRAPKIVKSVFGGVGLTNGLENAKEAFIEVTEDILQKVGNFLSKAPKVMNVGIPATLASVFEKIKEPFIGISPQEFVIQRMNSPSL